MNERTVTITDQDVEFVRLAVLHYRVFAEASERQERLGTADAARTSGILRSQEFYAERFLLRIEPAEASHG